MVQDPNGETHIYFGGIGKPDGPGHAHYVLDPSGKLIWRREVGASHSWQNVCSG
jgi:hypothetical protein